MRKRRRVAERARSLGAAERGRIVQKIIVDDWSAADAAAAFDLDERLIAAWVEDYRRRGMASLRESGRRGVPSLPLAARAWRRVAGLFAGRPWRRRAEKLAQTPRSPGREPSAGGDS